jgi:two-component system, NtrC family, nitrogen regulation response regulator NtrX
VPKNKPKIILIADDNKNICSTLSDILCDDGYVVDTVNDGYELLAYLEKKIPDVVILDIMMPAKGGLEVLNTIKSVSADIKVIIYTGFSQYQTSVYASVVDRFLLKTDSPDKVIEAVESLT